MNKKKLQIFILSLSASAFLMFHFFVLIKYDFYYIVPWIDIPMHIFGGFLIGLFFIIFNKKEKYIESFFYIFLAVISVGIIWEVYEYISDLTNIREWKGLVDTVKDLLNDVFGAFISYTLFKYINKNSR